MSSCRWDTLVVEGLQPEGMAQKVRMGKKRKADDVYTLGFSNFLVMSKPFLCPFCECWDLQREQYDHQSLMSVSQLHT